MRRDKLPERFQTLLKTIPYVTIATVTPDGRPWNSPVVGRFDKRMNLLWVSWRGSQHSRNIRHEPRIFVVIFDSRAPEGSGEGLYFQMWAEELTVNNLALAQKAYDSSFFEHDFSHQQFSGNCPQRMYRAVLEKVWYNIDGHKDSHFIDERSQILI